MLELFLIEVFFKEDFGKIYFLISYDFNEMVFFFKIFKVIGFFVKDFSGISDFFVKILFFLDKKYKMEIWIKRKNLNLIWNEVF